MIYEKLGVAAISEFSYPCIKQALERNYSVFVWETNPGRITSLLKYLLNSEISQRILRDYLSFGSDYTGLQHCQIILETINSHSRSCSGVVLGGNKLLISLSNDECSSILEETPFDIAGHLHVKAVNCSTSERLFEIFTYKNIQNPQMIRKAADILNALFKSWIKTYNTNTCFTARLRLALLIEAIQLTKEGFDPIAIERDLEQFGFRDRPILILQRVEHKAIVEWFCQKDINENWHDMSRAEFSKQLASYVEHLKNQKTKFKKSRSPYRWSGSISIQHNTINYPINEEVVNRCMLTLVNETVRCLDEKIILSSQDANLATIIGIGFPLRFRGPFEYINQLGPQTIVDQLRDLRNLHGKRFEPALSLQENAKAGAFYP